MKKIYLSGVIGWDVTAKSFREQLLEANGEDIEVHISSDGGGVGACLEMYNDLKRYKGKTTAIYTGHAMSAASYIPLAADKRLAERNAVYMIHNAQGCAIGDHNEMYKTGKTMQAVSSMVAGFYADLTGTPVDKIKEMMDETTFFVGGQAIVDAGFADELIGSEEELTADKATATLMFNEAVKRMTADQDNAQQDLKRTLTMLGDVPKGDKAHRQKKEVKMDLKMLKEKHSDLVALITQEAQAEMQSKIDSARAEGAEAERARIQSVKAQELKGFESIVELAMFDGKSTAGDVAIAINQAHKTELSQQAQQLTDDAPPVVDEPANSMKLDNDKGPLTKEKLQAKWEKDANLQAEFCGDFETYLAYKMPGDGVKFETLSNVGDK